MQFRYITLGLILGLLTYLIHGFLNNFLIRIKHLHFSGDSQLPLFHWICIMPKKNKKEMGMRMENDRLLNSIMDASIKKIQSQDGESSKIFALLQKFPVF